LWRLWRLRARDLRRAALPEPRRVSGHLGNDADRAGNAQVHKPTGGGGVMQRSAPAHQLANAAPGAASPERGAQLRRINSRELLGAAQEVEISHTGQIYRLRLTALGKLILTK
jgi:hemin uptake protein HemP